MGREASARFEARDEPRHCRRGILVRRVELAHLILHDDECQALHGRGDERRGEVCGIDAVLAEYRLEGFHLHSPNVARQLRYLCLERGAVIRRRCQLDEQGRAPRVRSELPPRSQWLGRCQRRGHPFHIALGAAAEHGDEQVVERPEVVVKFQARLRLDPAGRHRCVPVAAA